MALKSHEAAKVNRRLVLWLPLVSLGLPACAQTVRSTNWSESIYAHADVFALAAGIAPLRNGDRPEVRVWVDNLMFGEVVGRATTADRVAEYTLNWVIDDNVRMILTRRASRRPHANPQPASFSEILSQLQSLDGQNWGCAVDGVSILVDGVADGHRFAFSVSNPEFCDDDRSRLALRGASAAGPSSWQPLGGRTQR